MIVNRRQLQWLIAIRMVAITSMVLPFVLALPGEGATPPRFLYMLAGVTYVLSLVYVTLLRLMEDRIALHAVVQLIGDLSIVTGLYYFGGTSSAFSLLYLVVIAVASTLLRKRVALPLANLAGLMYATVFLGLNYGWITPVSDLGGPSGFLAYNLAVHVAGFNVVALLVSYLATSARAVQTELDAKRADLIKLENFHRDITNSISSGLITTDKDGTVITINPAASKILDCDPHLAVGKAIYDIGVCNEDEWRRVAKITSFYGMQREESKHTQGGEDIYIGYSVTQLERRDDRARGYIVIFQDVTRWRHLEREMRIKDRMAAIGELSAGIAHEIRNPLAAISGSVQMLSSTVGENGSSAKLLDIIVSESRRLDRTIEGFLKFARPNEQSATPFDVAGLLRENVELLRNSDQVSENHSVELELDPPSAHVLGDRDQMSQIFWNLARNALSAMPDGGTLAVTGSVDDSSYEIRFRDNGKGMTEEQRQTMFQPFKTSFDGGSGLGMAIVYRLVQEHGGELGVESEPGKGTTVMIQLPIASPNLELTVASA